MTLDEPAQPASPRVSIIARVVPALSYALPALGAAISSLLLIRVFQGLRNAETSGMAAITGGISEANLAILITLYLGVVVGLGGVVIGLVRMFTTTVTASPSAWYYLIAGLVGVTPMFAHWHAQSLILDVIFARTMPEGGVAAVASQVTLSTIIAIIIGGLSILILMASAFVPLPVILRAKRKWPPLIMLLVMETVIIAMTVAYQLRTAWLYAEQQNY